MILLLLALVSYLILSLVNAHLLLYLSVPILLLVLYVLPIVLNSIIYKLQKSKLHLISAIITPTFSLFYYLLFAYIVSTRDTWNQFVQLNTLSDSNMSLEIATNLFDTSQLLFITVLFYGISLTHHFISHKVSKKGLHYA